jgi:hypothetical protein
VTGELDPDKDNFQIVALVTRGKTAEASDPIGKMHYAQSI